MTAWPKKAATGDSRIGVVELALMLDWDALTGTALATDVLATEVAPATAASTIELAAINLWNCSLVLPVFGCELLTAAGMQLQVLGSGHSPTPRSFFLLRATADPVAQKML
ncbi:hypothetical protein [Nocardia gipuzkoensis]